jgi:hypothetical protein
MRAAEHGPSQKAIVDKEKVSAALRELADEHRGIPRSDTARLREVLNDVEDTLAAGASHSAVLDTLHHQGFTLMLSSFQSTLTRLRKERYKGPDKQWDENLR